MEIDPEMTAFPVVTPETYTEPVERRKLFAPIFTQMAAAAVVPKGMEITDKVIPGPAENPSLTVRIYRPKKGTLPVLLYMHGGGFVFGDLDSEHGRCVQLSETAQCVVVSVDYRVAPEHPYPACVDDSYAALEWIAAEARTLDVDLNRIAVGGTSAGGALAAAMTQAARDRRGPKICFQHLNCPVLDDRMETPSMRMFTAVPIFSRFQAERMWRYYLGPSHKGPAPVYAAPARATSLKGLPPAYILACGLDPLRDEAVAYGARLMAEGIPVEIHVIPSVPHAFDLAAPDAARSKQTVPGLLEALRRALNPPQ